MTRHTSKFDEIKRIVRWIENKNTKLNHWKVMAEKFMANLTSK